MKKIIDAVDYKIYLDEKFIKIEDKRVDKTISKKEIDLMMSDIIENSNLKNILIKTGENTLISSDARKQFIHLTKKESYKIGIIIHNLPQRILVNFTIRVLKRNEMKLFINEKEAIQWISKN